MAANEIQRNKDGRIIGMQHSSDPLSGSGQGLSAIATAGAYLREVAEQYELDQKLLATLEERVPDAFQQEEDDQRRLRAMPWAMEFCGSATHWLMPDQA